MVDYIEVAENYRKDVMLSIEVTLKKSIRIISFCQNLWAFICVNIIYMI